MTMTFNGTTGLNFPDGSTQLYAAPPQIMPVSASVAANALTITLGACSLAFRSTTLSVGTATQVTNTGILSITVPSTATLGTVNATQSDIVVLAINNAGSMELAVVNISGGTDISETNLISTTTIAGASNSATTVYSTTGRTSVAYRVVGIVRSTQATAGTWATAPALVQGAGGAALEASNSLGYGQTWQTVTGGRAFTTAYYNTTGRPILVIATFVASSAAVDILVNGTSRMIAQNASATSGYFAGTVLVPPGQTYQLNVNTGSPAIFNVQELK